MSYIVTGGCGFIGSNFVNHLCNTTDEDVFVIDKMTYAASESNIDLDHYRSGQVRVYKCDLGIGCDALDNIFDHNTVNGVFHFAAESHVDNSITGPKIFIDANVVGTFNMLEYVRAKGSCRFLHVSTDEVYGTLPHDGPSFLESKVLEPNNVYSATKAGSDLLVRAYSKTYGLDTVITRCCNNYGPRQHTEKLLPKVINNALNGTSIPVYGKGDNVREWIFVEDHCKAILEIFKQGESGEIYNIGSGIEITNLLLVKKVLANLKKPFNLIKFVKDRPGHDFRYSIDSSKLTNMCPDLEFTAFEQGLDETIKWYKQTLSAPEA
jgi:dTDP-glucose 4,6-dehydratase